MSEQLLYISINIAVISIPFLFSFDKRVAFYKEWKFLIPSILIVGSIFIAWDMWFTAAGYWGFNERYHSAIRIFNLPLGEVLFFVTVPYACVFIYVSLQAYLGKYFEKFPSVLFLSVFIILAAFLMVGNFGKPYTTIAIVLSWLISVFLIYQRPKYLPALCIAYIVSIIPFLLVNGLLTGSWIEEEIVWYNIEAFSSRRIFTIPMEDLFYSFNLIASTIILMEFFNKGKIK